MLGGDDTATFRHPLRWVGRLHLAMPIPLPRLSDVASGDRVPLIGVTTRPMQADGRSLDVVERAYADALRDAGGEPRLLAYAGTSPGHTALAGLDALLLTGGGDVDPGCYNEPRQPETAGVDADRDAWEIELVRRALTRALPILGICRGCQIINVACGGTLIQHVPAMTRQPHLIVEPRDQAAHAIRLRPGSRLAALEDRPEIAVNSIHHQAVHRLGRDLAATAWADDGIVEAIEHRSHPLLGVQWHPENLAHLAVHRVLFQWLVQMATEAAHPRG
jgi:putative glutamine amidotransferase